MFKISEFASLLGVSTKTLRFYEKKGLIVPAKVDENNSYRMYDSEQIKELSQIIQLKRLGFSLGEIRKYKNERMSVQEKIEVLSRRKELIDELLNRLRFQSEKTFAYAPYVKEEKPMRAVLKSVHVGHFRELIDEYRKFYNEATSGKITLSHPEYRFVEFLDGDYRDCDISATMGLGVSGAKGNTETVVLPVRKYVAVIHRGSFENIHLAYEFLDGYVALQGYKIAGFPSERYIENSTTKENEEDYITEVRFPIE